jgi:serralysin
MANYKFYIPNGDFQNGVGVSTAFADLLSYGDYETSGTTGAVYAMDNGFTLYIKGKNLTYDKQSLNGGTISSLVVRDAGGHTIQSITDLSFSGKAFQKAVLSNDSWALPRAALAGKDTLTGSAGPDELFGMAGNDTIKGGDGGDSLDGGRGKDTFDGGANSDGLDQLSFADTYYDYEGLGSIKGGVKIDAAKGTDTDAYGNKETFKNIEMFKGSQLGDEMLGSSRDEVFRGMIGKDYIDGRGGTDEVRYDRDWQMDGEKGVTVDLSKGYAIDGNGDRDTLKNVEDVKGSFTSDRIIGNGGDNYIRGIEGNDKLTGGAGKDTFSFDTKLDGKLNVDTITDFNVNDDTIDLLASRFAAAGGEGDLDPRAFWASKSGKAHETNDRIIYDTSDGHLYYDADGTGKIKAVQFADLASELKLKATHFDIVV